MSKRKVKPGLIIMEIHRNLWEGLNDNQIGQLLKVLFNYHFDGVVPENLSDALRIAFNCLKPVLDQQKLDYQETCKINANSIQEYWDKKKGK